MELVRIATDTATICMFDPTCLQHRVDDVGDWWSIPRDELAEVNAGNALIMNVGSDGTYDVYYQDHPMEGMRSFALRIPSGRFFVGQGEQLSGGGFEPDVSWGGAFREISAGNYLCSILKRGNTIHIHLRKGGEGANYLKELLTL